MGRRRRTGGKRKRGLPLKMVSTRDVEMEKRIRFKFRFNLSNWGVRLAQEKGRRINLFDLSVPAEAGRWEQKWESGK